MSAPASDNTALSVWTAFCEELAAAGESALAPASSADGAHQADGALTLGVLVETALRWHLCAGDPDFPHFVELNDTPEVADNLFAPVRGGAVYRLTGAVASLFDFNISLHTDWAWLGRSRVSGDFGRSELEIDEEGCFELVLSADRPEGARNWMPLPADVAYVQIREYFPDYEPRRPGAFRLERLDAAQAAPDRPQVADLKAALEAAVAWADRYVAFHRRAQERLFPDEPNTMRPPAPTPGGNRHIWYGFGRFDLAGDQALLIEFDEPQARLWSVQWQKADWFENADTYNRFTSLPGGEAFVNADGRVRIVVSASDCSAPNWLETDGYRAGLFVTRWIWCEEAPPVELSVVPLSEVRSHLPSDTPFTAANERAAQRSRRRMHFAHRRR